MYIFGKTPITLKEQAQDKERELKDLIRKSVPEEIINQANIMGKSNGSRGDLVELIYQQLFLIDPTADNKEKNMTQQQAYESLVSTLLGAIGTVYFNRHIDSLNTSNRKNEIDLNNGTKKGASADIMYNQNGEIHVVELKTGNGLILEESECKWKPSESEKEISRGSLDGIIGLPSEEERQIHNGRAALEQAKKLCLYRDKVKKENNQDVVVHVAYFRGCDVSTSLSQELSDLGVKKFQIPFDVEKIYDYINNLLGYIYDTGRNIMNPVENHRKISLPSMPPFMEENTGYGEIEVNKIESMRERFLTVDDYLDMLKQLPEEGSDDIFEDTCVEIETAQRFGHNLMFAVDDIKEIISSEKYGEVGKVISNRINNRTDDEEARGMIIISYSELEKAVNSNRIEEK